MITTGLDIAFCIEPRCEYLTLDPRAYAGERVKVFWAGDDAWYPGTVLGYALETSGLHQVLYDEDRGFTYEEDLLGENAVNIRCLDSGEPFESDDNAKLATRRLGCSPWLAGELLVVRGSSSDAEEEEEPPFWLAIVLHTKGAKCEWLPIRWLHLVSNGIVHDDEERSPATVYEEPLGSGCNHINQRTVLCRWGVLRNWSGRCKQRRVARRLRLCKPYESAAKEAVANVLPLRSETEPTKESAVVGLPSPTLRTPAASPDNDALRPAAGTDDNVFEASEEQRKAVAVTIDCTGCTQAKALQMLRRADWDAHSAVRQYFARPRRQRSASLAPVSKAPKARPSPRRATAGVVSMTRAEQGTRAAREQPAPVGTSPMRPRRDKRPVEHFVAGPASGSRKGKSHHHPWLGQRVLKYFDNVAFAGTITRFWQGEHPEWLVSYDDGDSEDLDISEVRVALQLVGNGTKRQRLAPVASDQAPAALDLQSGVPLMAMDNHGRWYHAEVKEVAGDEVRVLLFGWQFRVRHDLWIELNQPGPDGSRGSHRLTPVDGHARDGTAVARAAFVDAVKPAGGACVRDWLP